MSGLTLSGTVLEIEPVSGESNGNSYAFMRLHILAGLEVIQARVSDDFLKASGGALPEKGEEVQAHVAVTARATRNSAYVSYTLLRPARAASRPNSAPANGEASKTTPVRAAG